MGIKGLMIYYKKIFELPSQFGTDPVTKYIRKSYVLSSTFSVF